MTARDITLTLHSRKGSNTLVLLSSVALWAAGCLMPSELIGGEWPATWYGCLAGLAITLSSAVILHLTNKRFNMMRSYSALTPALFMSMSMALPPLALYPGTPSLLALAAITGAHLLFTTYGDPARRRRVFLLFAAFTALGMGNSVYWYYLPVMLIGCVQMRIFSLKTFLAALLGIMTPPWIAVGFTLMSIDDIRLPQLSVPTLATEDATTLTMLGAGAITIIAGVMFVSANLLKVYSYNSQTRAFNGFYTLLFLFTTLFTLLDFNNLQLYIPLLMAMVSYQGAHFFSTRASSPRSWIGIVLFLSLYWGTYVWYVWFMPTN